MQYVQLVLDFWTHMFDYRGRSSRQAFFIGFIVNAILLWIIFSLISFVFGFVGGITDADEGTMEAFSLMFFIILYILYLLGFVSLLNRRLRDAGFNPWWTLGNFVPLLQIVVWVFTFFPTKNIVQTPTFQSENHSTQQ